MVCAGLCCQCLTLHVVPETLRSMHRFFEMEQGCPERILQVGT
jgi:hypothetical protein